MKCNSCGAELEENSKFCTNCGAPVPSPEYEVTDVKPIPTTKPGNYGKTAINDRMNFWLYLLLFVCTCGIYHWIFYYKLNEDVNTMCEGDGEEPSSFIVFFILSCCTCGLYSYFYHYKIAERMYTNGSRYNAPNLESGSNIILWLIIGSFIFGVGYFVAIYMFVENHNKLARAYNAHNGLTYK